MLSLDNELDLKDNPICMKEYLETSFQLNNMCCMFAMKRKKDTNMSLFLECMRFVDKNREILNII